MDQSQDPNFGGAGVRRHITNFNAFDNYQYSLLKLGSQPSLHSRPILHPHFNYYRYQSLPKANESNPADGICSHYLLHGFNRIGRAPITVAQFSPDAQRLILGTEGGDFTLWEADNFRFERSITASSSSIRALAYKKSGNVLIMGDQGGVIHYFNSSLKLSYSTNGHDSSSVRGLSCSPGEVKFASCGDNGMVKIWDWRKGLAELTLAEHHGDVRCVDWHPYRGLVASGSKDNTIKLWDPRQAASVTTIYGHKNTVLDCKWNLNGNWLATGSRDYLAKVFDIRAMKELQVCKGHFKEVCSVAWHPFHEDLLVSGGFQGSLIYWLIGTEGPHTIIANAHNYSVNCLQWHPVGNCLISGANDGIVKVWGREPPGSTLETHSSEYQDAIKVHHGPLPAGFKGAIPEATAPTYITTEGGPGGNKGFKERGGRGPSQQGEKKYGPGSWEARGNNKSWGGSRGTNQSAGFPVGPGPDRGNATSYGSATSKSSIVPPSDDNVADGTSGRRVRSRFA